MVISWRDKNTNRISTILTPKRRLLHANWGIAGGVFFFAIIDWGFNYDGAAKLLLLEKFVVNEVGNDAAHYIYTNGDENIHHN